MAELTEDAIKERFSDKTFFKGLGYYEGGNVLSAVKIENILYAQVLGSAAKPYEVRASINDSEISTECTCPVGFMCKHGVALLLKWVHEPTSFIDADQFLLSLERINKSEIISIIEKILKHNPFLITEFSIEIEEKPEINIDAISEKIGWIVHGELDYYHIYDAIGNLEDIKNIADRLKEKGSYKNAAEIYMTLVKGGMTAYDEGADDSDGGMGDFVYQCITGFNECMEQIDDIPYKNKLLEKILDIVEKEDYGLETQEMLYSVLTEENISRIEKYMLEKLEEKRKLASDSSYKYKKEGTIELLIELYEKLGKPEEKLRLARYELADREDYARLANVLAEDGKLEEAFDAIKKGLTLPKELFSSLNKLYFDLAERLIHEKPDIIDFKISLDLAFEMLSKRFDKEEYESMKKIFSGIGKLEEFKSALLKNLKNRDNIIQTLMHDGELGAAINIIRSEPRIYPRLIIEVSKSAKDRGMIEESSQLTRIVLELGWSDASSPMKELIKAMIKTSDMEVLRKLCDHIVKKGDSGTAILLIPYLVGKAPELAVALAKKFINAMPVELVVEVARAVAEKEPEEGVLLCRIRLNEDIFRSHVHYDKAILLLRTIRDIYAAKKNEAKWVEYIRKFAAEHKGKKKMIEMVRKELGAV